MLDSGGEGAELEDCAEVWVRGGGDVVLGEVVGCCG